MYAGISVSMTDDGTRNKKAFLAEGFFVSTLGKTQTLMVFSLIAQISR